MASCLVLLGQGGAEWLGPTSHPLSFKTNKQTKQKKKQPTPQRERPRPKGLEGLSLPPHLSPAGATDLATWDRLGGPLTCLPDPPVRPHPSLQYIIINVI